MSGTSPGYPSVPEVLSDEKEHRRQIAKAVNSVRQGKMNAVTTVTLAANVATTTLQDARITIRSCISFMPTTANAAAEIGNGTMYVSNRMSSNGNTPGTATITHANNAQTDRSFTVSIIG